MLCFNSDNILLKINVILRNLSNFIFNKIIYIRLLSNYKMMV